MQPNDIVDFVKQIGPWVGAVSDALWYVLNEIVIKLLGLLLIISHLTPTEADNRILNAMLKTVNKATGKGDGQ